MGGLAVLFLLGLYFVLTVLAVIKVKPVWAKGPVLLAVLLIPTADAMYGRYKLKQMCAAEAGLKVYRVAHNVEGFADTDASGDYWVKEHAFQFIERLPQKLYTGNSLYHLVTNRWSRQGGQIVIEEKVSPKSRYRVNSKYIGWVNDSYLRNQYFVEDIATGEILATDTLIAFNGGWAERLMGAFSDAGAGSVGSWCSNTELDPVIRHRRIVLNTLKHSGE